MPPTLNHHKCLFNIVPKSYHWKHKKRLIIFGWTFQIKFDLGSVHNCFKQGRSIGKYSIGFTYLYVDRFSHIVVSGIHVAVK